MDIILCAALLGLARVVLLLGPQLRLAIARDARNGAADSARDTVHDAAAKVIELALRFLSLALRVLVVAFLLQALLSHISILFYKMVDGGMGNGVLGCGLGGGGW